MCYDRMVELSQHVQKCKGQVVMGEVNYMNERLIEFMDQIAFVRYKLARALLNNFKNGQECRCFVDQAVVYLT